MKALESRLNLNFRLKVPQALAGNKILSKTELEQMSPESLQDAVEQVFVNKEEHIFLEMAKRFYSPMLELVEGKVRKHADFYAALVISPTWMDLAEKYEDSLISRVRGLMQSGQIDLVYDLEVDLPFRRDKKWLANLMMQIRTNQERFWRLCGTKCWVACLGDLSYSDEYANLVEKMEFEGFLVRQRQALPAWQNPNWLYLPASCDKIVTFVQNDGILRDLKVGLQAGELGVEQAYRLISTECLKGETLTLVLDAEELQICEAEMGGSLEFWRELIEQWFKNRFNSFVSLVKSCEHDVPVAEIMNLDEAAEFDAEKAMANIHKRLAREQEPKVELQALEKKPAPSVEQKPVLEKTEVNKTDEAAVVVQKKLQTGAKSAEKVQMTPPKRQKREDKAMVTVHFQKKPQPVKKTLPQVPRELQMSVTEAVQTVKVEQPRPVAKTVLQSATPRPIKAPGFKLQARQLDEAQRKVVAQQKVEIDSPVVEKLSQPVDSRKVVDFDDLWRSKQAKGEESVVQKQSKLPSIGSGNVQFRQLDGEEEEPQEGAVTAFDYDKVDMSKNRTQAGFRMIEVGDFGKIVDLK